MGVLSAFFSVSGCIVCFFLCEWAFFHCPVYFFHCFDQMFGQLPAVCELMGADVASLVPHLDVAVSITLPSITSRAMLSQWIQVMDVARPHVMGVACPQSDTSNVACTIFCDSRYIITSFFKEPSSSRKTWSAPVVGVSPEQSISNDSSHELHR